MRRLRSRSRGRGFLGTAGGEQQRLAARRVGLVVRGARQQRDELAMALELHAVLQRVAEQIVQLQRARVVADDGDEQVQPLQRVQARPGAGVAGQRLAAWRIEFMQHAGLQQELAQLGPELRQHLGAEEVEGLAVDRAAPPVARAHRRAPAAARPASPACAGAVPRRTPHPGRPAAAWPAPPRARTADRGCAARSAGPLHAGAPGAARARVRVAMASVQRSLKRDSSRSRKASVCASSTWCRSSSAITPCVSSQASRVFARASAASRCCCGSRLATIADNPSGEVRQGRSKGSSACHRHCSNRCRSSPASSVTQATPWSAGNCSSARSSSAVLPQPPGAHNSTRRCSASDRDSRCSRARRGINSPARSRGR